MVKLDGRDLLVSDDLTEEDCAFFRREAVRYQRMYENGGEMPFACMSDLILVTIFDQNWPFTERAGFESAWLHMGGQVVSVGDAQDSMSIVKGENGYDTGRTVGAYCRVIVLGLGSEEFSVQFESELARGSEVPVISCKAIGKLTDGLAPAQKLWLHAALLALVTGCLVS